MIQTRFKNEMGLIIDKPKPGCGNTNDGNTARRFFGNPEKSAEITGLDVSLIEHFDTLLGLCLLVLTLIMKSLKNMLRKQENYT